jgi:subfamily B ATP-binding cassette protein MsbA
LLDTLFQETGRQKTTNTSAQIEEGYNILPDWTLAIKDGISETFNEFVFSGDKLDAPFRICLIVLIAFLAKNVFGYVQAYFLAFVEQGAMKDLRDEAYTHLHKLPMSYFKQERVGNLISRITNDVNIVQGSIAAAFLNMIREPFTIFVFLAIAISISWQLLLMALIVLPFTMLIITWIGLKLRKYSSIIQAKMADLTSTMRTLSLKMKHGITSSCF